MANQSISVSRNYDDSAVLGLANGETWTINDGARLTVNSDVRWGQNAAVAGAITISATTGGELLLDGRDVWWLPFDASTGNVPALGTVGVQDCTGGTSGATGEFLGVWTALGVAPTAAASAMPASGFLKFRSKVGTFVDNETVTLAGGATVTVNSATGGVRGWIHFVMSESAITANQLGAITSRGDWFYLSNTTGTDGQTLQYPVADYCPALEIETSAGSGVYEKWTGVVSSAWNSTGIATDDRGLAYLMGSNGLITFGGTTTGYGKTPASGCKVRIPNVLFSSSTSANWALNTLQAVITSRARTAITLTPVDLEFLSGSLAVVVTTGGVFRLLHSHLLDRLVNASLLPTQFVIDNCAQGAANDINGAVLISSCPFGGEIKNTTISRPIGSTFRPQCMAIVNSANITIDNLTTRFNQNIGSNAPIFDYCSDIVVKNSRISGRLAITNSSRVQLLNNAWCDKATGTYNLTNPAVSVDATATSDLVIDGYSYAFGVEIPPASGLFTCINNTEKTRIRNIGTYAAPLDLKGNTAVIASIGGNGHAHRMSRVYVSNMRGAIRMLNSDADNAVFSDCGHSTQYTADTVRAWGTNHVLRGVPGMGLKTSGTNAGQIYAANPGGGGTHFLDIITSDTEKMALLYCNEKTAQYPSNIAYTVDSGAVRFDGTSGMALLTSGDQVTWTWTYWIKQWTSFQNVALITHGAVNLANHTLTYDLDKGQGFSGTFQSLTGANLAAESGILPSGFRLRIRALCNVSSTTNRLNVIGILGNTSVSDITANPYPLNEPELTLTGVAVGSDLDVYNDSTGAHLVEYLSVTGETTAHAGVPWDADFTACYRLRKPGYAPIEATYSCTETAASFASGQTAWTIPASDPGSLSIAVTNHGASPVTWQSKQWSITITASGGETAAQIAQWYHWQIRNEFPTFTGFRGSAWPTAIQPSAGGYETQRGKLFGSAGAALKGVRVVDGSGEAVPGFDRMQADDGTYWSAPNLASINLSGAVSGSRILVRNTTTNTTVFNGIATGYTEDYADGTTFTGGDEYLVVVTQQSGATAKLEKIYEGIASSSGFAIVITQADDTTYNTWAINGSALTGITFNTSSIDLDLDGSIDPLVPWSEVYARYAYSITTSAGILTLVGAMLAKDTVNYAFSNAVVINNASATPVRVGGDGYGRRVDGGSMFGSGNIQIDNGVGALAVEVGTSGLTPTESSALLAIQSKTAGLNFTEPGQVDANVRYVRGQQVTGTGTEADPWGPL